MIILAISLPGFSQVGIGTLTPHRSSMLDVVSDTSGFLPPRMTDTQMLAIGQAVSGLMVYNTTFNRYYYYDGVSWLPVSPSGNGWSLTGNDGVDPWNNFLGTIDTAALRFRVFNERSGIIDWSRRATSFGYRSLYNNSAYDNSAFGEEACTPIRPARRMWQLEIRPCTKTATETTIPGSVFWRCLMIPPGIIRLWENQP